MGFSCTENSDLNDPYSDLFINKYGPIQRKSRPFDWQQGLKEGRALSAHRFSAHMVRSWLCEPTTCDCNKNMKMDRKMILMMQLEVGNTKLR